MDREIRTSIAAALENRRAQREPIGRLEDAWLALTEGIESLVMTLGETSARLTTIRQPTAEQAMLAEGDRSPAGSR